MNVGNLNQLKAGSVIYKQGEIVDTICVILEGRVIAYNQGIKTIMSVGSFIGISDICEKVYITNYIAYENITLYAFQINDKKDIKKIMNFNKDYSGLMVCNLNKYITDLSRITTALTTIVDETYRFIHELHQEFIDICSMNGHVSTIFSQNNEIVKYESAYIFDSHDLKYYEECLQLPEDIQKTYFSCNSNLSYLHVVKQSELINKLIKESIHMATYIKEIFEIIFSDKEECIFKELSKIALDIKNAGGSNDDLIVLLSRMITKINITDRLLSEKSGCKLKYDKKIMEGIYSSVISGTNEDGESKEAEINLSNSSAETAINELRNSLEQILTYAEIEEEEKDEIKQLIVAFSELKDKTSISENVRIIRKKINETFYELYLKVYLKTCQQEVLSRVIELFLNYGFVEETLLTTAQCVELYYLKDENEKQGNCCVYTFKEWLDEIYAGRKEPSKNEFDLEYNENLREIKKYNQMSAAEENDYLTNPIKKVGYEIKNIFRYNNRLVNGQVSIFVPILHEGIIIKTMSKMLNTRNKINLEIDHLVSIDYSAFYREVLFYDASRGIPKEYIVKQAFPDVILLPTVGCNSVMWQEIEGRKRDTSGRFLFPIFGETDLFDMLVKAIGRFRFELCRTIEGISWNDVREKSLTSDYSDYIQSYSKNRDLSEEQKIKIKHQVQRGRSNVREIFVSDYITWIQNESQGYLRLNKIARTILATYCPLAKELRERNSKQPLFEEAMARYIRDKQKKFRECSMSIKKLEKEHIEIPVELEETLKFYGEL
ncbi:cyclic nucleotide-binding domain-containing protein [[Clostridium] fimetarium]|uniref:cyclic nucleotide-binding domain-containing protein n=1 Tax=[Clostridium] fimetarium TaxID=99656 RepID=UPI0011133F69|nr:Crp/Fnr family transcriptional regulator [[Clostridium] fimetarium]